MSTVLMLLSLHPFHTRFKSLIPSNKHKSMAAAFYLAFMRAFAAHSD